MRKTQIHLIPPVYDVNSRVLILGSFPSVRSRADGFFYGHPQNRFWRVLSSIFCEEMPTTIEEKRTLLLSHQIALWDVIASCEVSGSSDCSIRNVIPNDLSRLLQTAPIAHIFTNGKTADAYYRRYQLRQTGMEAVVLPSTSPANAAFGLECLIEAWRVIAVCTGND